MAQENKLHVKGEKATLNRVDDEKLEAGCVFLFYCFGKLIDHTSEGRIVLTLLLYCLNCMHDGAMIAVTEVKTNHF